MIPVDPDGSSDDEFEETVQDQDYASAMESALNADDDNDEAADEDEEEAGFIYDGVDDEDTQTFRKDAAEGKQDYSQRLRGILDDDELVRWPLTMGLKHHILTSHPYFRQANESRELRLDLKVSQKRLPLRHHRKTVARA